jgi:hypothetical protein
MNKRVAPRFEPAHGKGDLITFTEESGPTRFRRTISIHYSAAGPIKYVIGLIILGTLIALGAVLPQVDVTNLLRRL